MQRSANRPLARLIATHGDEVSHRRRSDPRPCGAGDERSGNRMAPMTNSTDYQGQCAEYREALLAIAKGHANPRGLAYAALVKQRDEPAAVAENKPCQC